MTRVLAIALALPGAARAQPAAPFTIVALPDTQYYTCSLADGERCASRGPDIFESQTEWIADQRENLDIRYVATLGDCVENGQLVAEFQVADRAFRQLEQAVDARYPDGVPFGVTVGNHDQWPFGNPGSLSDEGSTTRVFNDFFGVERYCPRPATCRGYYGGHFGVNNDNHVQLFDANGYGFVVVSLEYMEDDTSLRRAVLDWAERVLERYAERRAIVLAHYVMEEGTGAPHSDQGEAIYEALKDQENLFLILGGHVPGVGRRSDTHDGRTVHTLLADFQSRSSGGDGWLRLLEFRPADDEIRVSTYSPWRDDFDTDSENAFTLEYDMSHGYPPYVAGFQQGLVGYRGARDVTLEPGVGPMGGEDVVGWDGSPSRVTLLRFDRLFEVEGGPIPFDATIRSAFLHYVAEEDGDDADLHEVRVRWNQGTTHDTFGPTPGVQPGEDYDPAPVGEASGDVDGQVEAHRVDVTASVQRWLADPSANHGWVLVPRGDDGASVRSSEHEVQLDRPRLVVTWEGRLCYADNECGDQSTCTTDLCFRGTCRNDPAPGVDRRAVRRGRCP